MLTVVEAIATGKRFKRKEAPDWFDLKETGNHFTAEDLKAKDYITEACMIATEDLTLAKLESIYVKINAESPGMSRGAFRELVKHLSGVTIK